MEPRKTTITVDDELQELLRVHFARRFGNEPQTMQTALNVAWTLLTWAALAWDKTTESEPPMEAADGFLQQAGRAWRAYLNRFTGSPKA